jgi:hypothetical protein
MTATRTDEGSQLDSVEERLGRSFGDSASPQAVHASVQRAYDSFEGAHIRTYIPVMVARMAAGELRAAVRARAAA